MTRLARRSRPLWHRQLERWPVWFTGAMLGLATLMIVGLLGLVLSQGLGAFWPRPLVEITLADGARYLGNVHAEEEIPHAADAQGAPVRRTLYRVANRDLYGNDFVWADDAKIVSRTRPPDAVAVERLEWGPFYGFIGSIATPDAGQESGTTDARGLWLRLRKEMPAAQRRLAQMRRIEKVEIGAINAALEKHRLAIRRAELRPSRSARSAERVAGHQAAIGRDQGRYAVVRERLEKLRAQDAACRVTLVSLEGKSKELPISSLVRVYRPNALSLAGKLDVYARRLAEFLFGQPREANSEGGVAPAIFGTVLMTILMSLAVVPFGVLAALYLHEYAKSGAAVSIVRIAVNNLAGVPSIVFGIFGLGFFCYFIGGTLDQLFFPERLPTPTFGGGGILWAALTLALLTVPVVIVATEEALAAVPNGLRAASLACGATKFQTICRVVLPAALPGILTGAILAMARGAGEVAPLMITGVVKLAPELPLDHIAPFIHLERKFMHLGFHIYDVGFQSPNVEAAKPMVYMTTLLLLGIVVCLNLSAMHVRGRLRAQSRGSEV